MHPVYETLAIQDLRMYKLVMHSGSNGQTHIHTYTHTTKNNYCTSTKFHYLFNFTMFTDPEYWLECNVHEIL